MSKCMRVFLEGSSISLLQCMKGDLFFTKSIEFEK